MEVEGESSAWTGLQKIFGHSRRAKRGSAFFPPSLSLSFTDSSSISSPSFSSSFCFSFFVLLLLARIAHSQPQCGIAAGNAVCPNNLCCSRFGFCGNTIEFCGEGCQSNCVLREPSLEGFPCPLTLPTPKPYTGKACRTRLRITSGGVGSGRDICSPRVDISECQLYEIMGGRSECPNCRFYYPFIIKAMADFGLNCPDRIAAFLATVRHETDALRTLFQPADCGGGGIHMIPQNFPLFLSGRGNLPDLRRQFDRFFRRGFRVGSNTTCARELLCASWIVQLPRNAFVTAGWWFRIGSRRALGAQGCRDLRRDADVGLGVPQQEGGNGATGFYKISRCVFGSLPDAGLPQRVRYYEEARRVTDRLK